MSLSSALNIAQSSLLNTGRQTSVVSRNVMDARNPDYARRSAVLSSTAPGARVIEIRRATNEQLFRQNLSSISSLSSQSTLYSGMDRLGVAVNGVDNAFSAATRISDLQQALQVYATTPSNRSLAGNAINAARDVVRGLNDATTAIQTFRVETDQEISMAVNDLNRLLSQFKDANKAVTDATRTGRDASDALDQRDALLKKISEYVPVSTITRSDNDMVVIAGDGTTLFETVPRSITFEPSVAHPAGQPGNAVYVDGVPLLMGTGGNTDAGGKIAGLVQLRDDVAVTMQRQLDEIARGLITAFAEKDPANVGQDVAGLFTWSGAPNLPPAGTMIDGLAQQITLNPAFVGNPEVLRDGATYLHNTEGGSSYADLLIEYGERLDRPMTFDPLAGNGDSSGLNTYATGSIGWFQGMRQEAWRATEAKEALAVRTAEALSNETGVNVDMEMSMLLDLEHSYQASARLISAVDEMLAALLAAVR
ncbi:flagellar hook-associated protein FlgK [Pseudaminobacter arsenicus]|uniref:Flagellar hook-associated protein 1 n=1 Tax=Borborobacter arsenicus TaxID=1851146 RepID=A0A432V5U3_9HYPH|nr:flagellar hook-associated protein FlgK [Pseudaminobacter arsenicus]RUM97532.1 flagellar hook-associated protein FlgK [Pseudaminobacter arsenicus]